MLNSKEKEIVELAARILSGFDRLEPSTGDLMGLDPNEYARNRVVNAVAYAQMLINVVKEL